MIDESENAQRAQHIAYCAGAEKGGFLAESYGQERNLKEEHRRYDESRDCVLREHDTHAFFLTGQLLSSRCPIGVVPGFAARCTAWEVD